MQDSPRDNSSRYRAITRANVHLLPEYSELRPELREALDVVSRVLPFKTNEYVVRELIDWSRVPDDPIFQLTFVQPGMLAETDYARIAGLVRAQASKAEIQAHANEIRLTLNPHPAGQLSLNVPTVDGRVGLAHGGISIRAWPDFREWAWLP